MKAIELLKKDVAVEKETRELFKSTKGSYFLAEESAVNDSYTHEYCEKHDIAYHKHSTCAECRMDKKIEKHNSREKTVWDESTPVYSEYSDKYYFSLEELQEDCEYEEMSIDNMLLYLCEPCDLRELEEEYWCDDWYDGAELPEAIKEAMDRLNEAVREHGKAFSWYPSKKAVKL